MTTRTKGAILIGIALVAAALVLSQYRTVPVAAPREATLEPPRIVTEPGLREYIPPTDSDGDGIPDWQELLDQTEPLDVPQATTTFDEPDTLTEQFALDFFQNYMRNQSFGDFGQTPDELIAEASDELVAEAQDELRTAEDVTVISGGAATIRSHANLVARAISNATLPEGTRNELEILEEAVARNNADMLEELNPIILGYSSIINEMELTPVPRSLLKEHLDLLNTLVAIRNDIAAFRNLYDDPMLALLRLRRYEDDVRGLVAAYSNFFEAAREQGAAFQPSDPVYTVYEFSE